MRVKQITIHNYRSIRHLELSCESLTVLLGANNHGKSNILSAIEFALTPGDKPKEGDYCSFRSLSTAPEFPWTPIWGQSPERCA